MALISLLLFLLAIALGLTTLIIGQRRRRPPVALGYLHGATALSALGLLIVRVATGPENLLLNSAVVVFLLAALGGLFTLAVRQRDEPPILALILLHATAGIVATSLLAAGVHAGG